MKRIFTVKLAIAAFVMAIGAVTYLSLVPETRAIFFNGVCTYYSSSKYKTVVGQFGTGCCGETIGWGTITPYRKCEQIYCLDVWCPPPTE